MARLIVGAFQSVDGVMQAAGGPDEDRDGGFALGGWSVPFWNEAMMAFQADQMKDFDSLLVGRRTYDMFAASWPTADEGADLFAAKLNSMPKFLVTSTQPAIPWNNTTVLVGDVVEAVQKLKQDRYGTIWTQGSTQLLKALFSADLVDEIRLWTFPVVIGEGKRFIAEGAAPRSYSLAETHAFDTGVCYARFAKSGPIKIDEMNVVAASPGT